MRILIVEDDFTSRVLLQKLLQPYGAVETAVNGREAMEFFSRAHQEGQPYRLICLDIMMPVMDGMETLKAMRKLERARGVPPMDEAKIIMTTALDSPRDIMEAYYRGGCTGYIVKPIDRARVLEELTAQGLV